MPYQQSLGFFQELKTTPDTEYFRPINLTFVWLFFLQRSWNEMKMPPWPILQQKQSGSENDCTLKLETLVCSVGANLQTTINVINCLRIENGWKVRKRTADFLQTHTLQKITRLHWKITRSLGQSKNHQAWHQCSKQHAVKRLLLQLKANLWRFSPWYCYARKANTRKIRSQVRPRNGVDTNEL